MLSTKRKGPHWWKQRSPMQTGHRRSRVHTQQANTEKTTDGTGSLYCRGKIWWAKYSKQGKIIRESTGTDDRQFAEDFLRARIHSNPHLRVKLPALAASSRCTIGAIAELTVSIALMNLGWSVYRAFSHNAPCDLVAIRGSEVLRIEVKTVTEGKTPTVDRSKFDHLALLIRGGEVVFHPPLPETVRVEPVA
jgi:hypothetical protein